jgi:arsenical resistance protein ArsH
VTNTQTIVDRPAKDLRRARSALNSLIPTTTGSFAVNSALHSYLILAFTKAERVTMDVGFYCMAKAGGRLLGTVLSGLTYQIGGLSLMLGTATLMVGLSALDLAIWSEGMVWSSPERHGAMSAIMKAQIDWIPLSTGGVRPTQGKTLALTQVCGGSQSFNAVNQMRILGRWMRMVTIPNQSSVPRAWDEFDQALRMRPSPLYLRLVDVCEELMKFTWMTRARSSALTDRYSERIESAEQTSKRVNQSRL